MLGLFFVSVEVMYITMVILCTPGIPGDVHAMEASQVLGLVIYKLDLIFLDWKR